MPHPQISVENVAKNFFMHLQGGARLPVVKAAGFEVEAGECVVLGGPSGAGKSSLLKMIFGNYRCDSGRILVADGAEQVNIVLASPRRILRLRQSCMGYVSQFLRVIPRVSALDIIEAAAREQGVDADEGNQRAVALLDRLRVPQHLWNLPPATFSGGEQQRINIARSFVARHPVLLIDEPTAALDAANRRVVVELIAEKKREGVAILGIFHDDDVRAQVADRIVDVTRFAAT